MFKELLNTQVMPNRLNLALLILRLSAGGLMLTHGFPKFQKIMNGDMGFADPIGLGPEISLYLTVFAELVCAFLLVIGLFTRYALVSLIICMAVAAFVVHGADPFGKKEYALLFLLPYIVLWLTGPGKYSVDEKLS